MYGFVTGYFANMVFNDDGLEFSRRRSRRRSRSCAAKEPERAVDAVESRSQRFPGRRRQARFTIMAGTMRGSPLRARSTITRGRGQDGRDRENPVRSIGCSLLRACSTAVLGLGPNASAAIVGLPIGLPSPSRDPAHDIVAALAHWVEDDASRQIRIIATLYRHNDPTKEIVAQRPWCPYPAVARFSGHGDRTDAASYACVGPLRRQPLERERLTRYSVSRQTIPRDGYPATPQSLSAALVAPRGIRPPARMRTRSPPCRS